MYDLKVNITERVWSGYTSPSCLCLLVLFCLLNACLVVGMRYGFVKISFALRENKASTVSTGTQTEQLGLGHIGTRSGASPAPKHKAPPPMSVAPKSRECGVWNPTQHKAPPAHLPLPTQYKAPPPHLPHNAWPPVPPPPAPAAATTAEGSSTAAAGVRNRLRHSDMGIMVARQGHRYHRSTCQSIRSCDGLRFLTPCQTCDPFDTL